MRMCKVPFDTQDVNEQNSPAGLPALAVNHGQVVTDCRDIIKLLSKMGYVLDRDRNMTAQEKADMLSFTSLVEGKLYYVQLFNWWLEIENFSRVTHNIYGNKLSFPLNWWLPRQMKKNITQNLEHIGFGVGNQKKVYEIAQECYEALSAKLGTQYYFFGNEPSTLDCTVYSFLMTQYAGRLPKNNLHTLISGHKNLVEFCNRMTKIYYGVDSQNLLNHRPLENLIKKKEKPQKSPAEKEEENNSSLAILWGLLAVALYTVTFNRYANHFVFADAEEENEEYKSET